MDSLGIHVPTSDFIFLEEGGLELWQLVTVVLTSRKFQMSPLQNLLTRRFLMKGISRSSGPNNLVLLMKMDARRSFLTFPTSNTFPVLHWESWLRWIKRWKRQKVNWSCAQFVLIFMRFLPLRGWISCLTSPKHRRRLLKGFNFGLIIADSFPACDTIPQ